MATLIPFMPIRPNACFADQLVFTKPQTESVAGDFPPLKDLLETTARKRPETSEGQTAAYCGILENLSRLLDEERLLKETSPGIYVYELLHKTYCQTGVWALTSLANYTSGEIKIHELTFDENVRRMKNYRANTGLEGSPILLTYPPDIVINRIIEEAKSALPVEVMTNGNNKHSIWKIEEERKIKELIAAFAQVPVTFLADGHHRLESAAELAADQKSTGKRVFNNISSLYMATDQLRIESYDRVVVPDSPVISTELFAALTQGFHIRESTGNKPVMPTGLHRMGMYFKGEWFHLFPKNTAPYVDAAILQDQILLPIFGIEDPKTDARLICAGGESAIEEILRIFGLHPTAVAFTLCPMKVEQLVRVAEKGQILPPKSTWIVPKVPYGLLIHQHISGSVVEQAEEENVVRQMTSRSDGPGSGL